MSEYYYRYNADDAPINLDDDEIYDYVLEREALKDLDNVGPRCMKTMGKLEDGSEHFGNLKKGKKSLFQNLLIVFGVMVILYFLYVWMCADNNAEIKPGNYVARLGY